MVKTVIAFCGTAGSGKDTSCQIIETVLTGFKNFHKYAFGTVLKEIVADLSKLFMNADFSVAEMDSLAYKEAVRPEYMVYEEGQERPVTIRYLLQHIGTDILRKHLGREIFANHVVKKIAEQSEEIALVTDLRFQSEYDALLKMCSAERARLVVVHISRPSKTVWRHVSETETAAIPKDIVVVNDGTIDNLCCTLLQIVMQIFPELKK